MGVSKIYLHFFKKHVYFILIQYFFLFKNTHMSTLERAIEIARKAHEGQSDKGGAPYITHPLRVMERAGPEEAKMAAVLHDVVEDTTVIIAL